MNPKHRTLLIWVVVGVMLFGLYQMVNKASHPKNVSYSDFITEVRNGKVAKVTISNNAEGPSDFRYTLKGKSDEKITQGKDNDNLLKQLEENNVHVQYRSNESSSLLTGFLLTWFPMIILALVFIFMMRQMQGAGGKAMSFGKSRARLLNEGQNKVTFADVAGIDEAKDDCEEIIAFLKDPKKFQRLGGRIPKGVLLMGSPGTGKTLLARAIAGEAGVPFFSISGSDFVEMFVGVGASRVRDLFEQGKKNAPCIIFIDEIDAVGRQRGAGMGGGHDEREQTLNQLLVEMDGFEANEGVIIIAATNRPDVLDSAILRPGRFDRRINVPSPDLNGRIGILGVHTKKVPLDQDVDLELIARGTPGFSGADLENLVNEAALLAARLDKDKVSESDFDLAKDKVIMGAERRSLAMSEHEKRTTAWHEAGHALVGLLLPGNDPVMKVTIIPRGRALGVTLSMPKQDVVSRNKVELTDRITKMLGGRTAEELTFGQFTTGASNDLEQATNLARAMVTTYGMSSFGPVSYTEEDTGYPGLSKREYSENTAQKIDEEVRNILNTQNERCKALLTEHKDKLDLIAEALLEHETLNHTELELLMNGQPLPPRKRVVIPRYSEKQKPRTSLRPKVPVFQPRPRET